MPLENPLSPPSWLNHPGKNLMAVVEEILEQYPDESFCFLNERRLLKKATMFQEHFIPETKERKIAFAVKSNPQNKILELLASRIDGFDCASAEEVSRIRALSPESRVFTNNPIMTRTALKKCLDQKVDYFTIQNENGIERILQTSEEEGLAMSPEVVVRMRTLNKEAKINISEKFGADPAKAMGLLMDLKQKGIRTGLAMNAGSQNTNPSAFVNGIRLMAAMARESGGVDSLNIGGGLPVNYHENDRFSAHEFLKEISEAVRKSVQGIFRKGTEDPKIIIEPGRSIVAETIDLFIPIVISEIRDGKRCLYINDGIFTSFSDFPIHKWPYHLKGYKRGGQALSDRMEKFHIYGRTCDSGDHLGSIELPENLEEGDYVWAPNAGAYMDSQSSFFHGFRPPAYVSYNPPEA